MRMHHEDEIHLSGSRTMISSDPSRYTRLGRVSPLSRYCSCGRPIGIRLRSPYATGGPKRFSVGCSCNRKAL